MSDDRTDSGFTVDQKRVLARALDEIIPPSDDGRLPGAGELGLAGYVDDALRTTPELRSMVGQSLAALDDLARRRNAGGFAELSASERSEVMNELATSEHAFPPVLLLHACAGYYQNPRVLEVLGLESRPPHPAGYEMEPNDLTLLDAVRRRPRMYREA
jgi:hypothetical protein